MKEKILEKIKQFPLVLISLILCMLFIGLTLYSMARMDNLEAERKSLNEERVVIEYNLLNGKSLNKDIERLKALNEIINGKLLDPKKRADDYQYFFSLEDKVGVKISNPTQIAVDPIMPTGANGGSTDALKTMKQAVATHAIITYRVEATGYYVNILNLIYNLQQSQYISRIKKVTISRAQQSLEHGALSANIEISYFGLPD